MSYADSSDSNSSDFDSTDDEAQDDASGSTNGAREADTMKGKYLGFSRPVLASLLCPNRELCDQPFELVVDALAFIGHPWIVEEEERDDNMNASRHLRAEGDRGRDGSGGIDVSEREGSFNFVMVIDTPPDSQLSSVLEAYHRDVVVPMTATLKYLQKREGWLKQDPMSNSNSASPSLADSFTSLYNSLKATSKADITLGPQAIPVQVLLRGETSTTLSHDYREDASLGLGDGDRVNQDHERDNEDEGEFREARPALYSRTGKITRFLPWQTLLPLEDPELLRDLVPEDTLLHRFIEIWSPTLCFAEYETLLDLDSGNAELREVIAHLVHWRKGRVIDVVSLKLVYALQHTFDPASLASLTPLFSTSFPSLLSLPLFLSRIPSNDAFSRTVPNASHRPLYLSALIWLLMHEVVEKQRTFYRIIASEGVKLGSRVNWRADQGGKDSLDRGSTEGSSSMSDSVDDSVGSARKRNISAQADDEDSRLMAIISASPTTPPLSRSQQSSMMMKFPRYRRNSALVPNLGRGRTLSTLSSNSERPEDTVVGSTIILEPGRPSLLESRWLAEMSREKDPVVVEKFERMVRMFNGAHDIDEIRHRSALSRKDVRLVLSAFEEHLVSFSHP